MSSKDYSDSRRRISTGACDHCRLKKIRCNPVGGDDALRWVQRGDTKACNACQIGGMMCTFVLPTRKRGPARKRKLKMSPHQEDRETGEGVASISEASQNPTSPSLDFSSPSTSTILPWQFTGLEADDNLTFPTDHVFPRSTYLGLIATYLDLVYPTIPIIHRPTFIRDIQNNRAKYDNSFLSLTVAICALVASLMPRKFEEFQHATQPLRFQTRTQMLEACCRFVLDHRPPDYFDTLSIQKWSIAYLLQVAHFQVGKMNRLCFWHIEAAQMTHLMGLGDPKSYQGLNCIEKQLRKKAFWLLLFVFVHQYLGNINIALVPLYDSESFNSIHVEKLWPIEVDDEFISDEVVLPQPEDTPSLTSGFNAGARLFWIACTQSTKDCSSRKRVLAPNIKANVDSKAMIESLRSRIEDLKTACRDSENKLTEWTSKERFPSPQFDSLQTNIQVTRVWLQSNLLEALIEFEKRSNLYGIQVSEHQLWHQREEICQQLLLIVYNVRQCSLEPNGNSLTYKIREVAATLLESPAEDHRTVPTLIKSYLNSFVEILARLDVTEHNRQFFLDNQAWSDLNTLSGEADHAWWSN